jgi:hypothetical protein
MDTIGETIRSFDRSAVAEDRRRFFIINAGRTGSTLLSVILADAGADFAMAAPPCWDRGGGDMEHPDLLAAWRRIVAAHTLSATRPAPGYRRHRWTILRSLGKRRLRAVLGKAQFVKVDEAHLLVRPAVKMGYFPSIILSYRRFEDHAVSYGLMDRAADLEGLVAHYNRVNKNGLWLLNTFGGCVIGYEQLIDLADRSWVAPLAALTNLPASELLAARARRVAQPSRPIETPHFDRDARQTYEGVDSLRGRLILPSTQALRSWHAANGAAPRQFPFLRPV